MVDYLLLGGSLGLTVSRNILSKKGKEHFSGLKKLMLVNIFTAVIAALVFIVTGLDLSKIDGGLFLLLGVLFGIFTMGSQTCNVLAIKYGDVSVCSMIYSSGFIFPTLYSMFFLGEEKSPTKIVGILLVLFSIVLINARSSKERTEKKSCFYLLFAIPAMLFSGAVGVLQKVFFQLFSDGQNEFLFIGFLFFLVVSLAVLLVLNIKKRGTEEESETKKSKKEIAVYLFFSLGYAFCAAVSNKLNMYLSGVISGVIFFPVLNGGCIVLTAVASMLLLKEKPTLFKCLGILGGVIAILLISL